MPPSQSRIQRLLEAQGRSLDRLSNRQARQVVIAYDAARRELREELLQLEASGRAHDIPFTAQRMRVMLGQTEAGVRRLGQRLDTVFVDFGRTQGELAVGQVLKQVELGEVDFLDAGPAIEVRALQRLSEPGALLLHRRSLERYTIDTIDRVQRMLTIGVARGASYREMAERVAGVQGVLAKGRGRAQLIVRMEMGEAYNRIHQASLEEAAGVLDTPDRKDPLLRRADEFMDSRNHPLSRALHGRTFPVADPMSVPIAAVNAWARAMKRSARGVVWERRGSSFVGAHYPAHFNDRGRQTAWRASWGDPGAEPTPSPPA